MAANVPAMEEVQEAIVDCFAFFCEEGKGGENFRKKNKFRCKVKHRHARRARVIFCELKASGSSSIQWTLNSCD